MNTSIVFFDVVGLDRLDLGQIMMFQKDRPRFQQHGLALDIPISWIDLPKGDVQFPVLKMTDTVQNLVKFKLVNKFLGELDMSDAETTLLTFWRRFSKQNPGHQVYAASARGDCTLARCIPVMIHGDEGRGFKRSGIMVLSVQGAIGKGSVPFLKAHPDGEDRQHCMAVNIKGISYNSRFLFGAMPKKHYSRTPDSCSKNV